MFDEQEPDFRFEPDDGHGPEPEEGAEKVQVALVSTRNPVPIRTALIDDERTPESMVCVGAFFGDRLIARRVVRPEVHEAMESRAVFAEPVRVALAAAERTPGLQCQLFALVPADALREEPDEPEEPWAASVPRYEDVIAEPAEDGDAEGEGDLLMAVPLGQIVRFSKNRKHPRDLSREAADVLQTVLDQEQPLTEVVDKVLEDLLDEVRGSDQFEPPDAAEDDAEDDAEPGPEI